MNMVSDGGSSYTLAEYARQTSQWRNAIHFVLARKSSLSLSLSSPSSSSTFISAREKLKNFSIHGNPEKVQNKIVYFSVEQAQWVAAASTEKSSLTYRIEGKEKSKHDARDIDEIRSAELLHLEAYTRHGAQAVLDSEKGKSCRRWRRSKTRARIKKTILQQQNFASTSMKRCTKCEKSECKFVSRMQTSSSMQRLKSATLISSRLAHWTPLSGHFSGILTHLVLSVVAAATASPNYMHSFLLFCSSSHGENCSKLNSIVFRSQQQNLWNISFRLSVWELASHRRIMHHLQFSFHTHHKHTHTHTRSPNAINLVSDRTSSTEFEIKMRIRRRTLSFLLQK